MIPVAAEARENQTIAGQVRADANTVGKWRCQFVEHRHSLYKATALPPGPGCQQPQDPERRRLAL